jgi:hypothetical protein
MVLPGQPPATKKIKMKILVGEMKLPPMETRMGEKVTMRVKETIKKAKTVTKVTMMRVTIPRIRAKMGITTREMAEEMKEKIMTVVRTKPR